ncbi:glycosyltransferase [uncultured Pedobacter sp.]|uniref:glycosyltransferase n=1 Tax=uncultured Pedobacter sp. TaxID=246139 RepID=UPI0025D35BD9|nr:glycosyltransferase [uncultured Pedobacter sp.]
MNEHKIYCSIIIPTLNSQLTLRDCLKSVFDQSFKDFEVIIVDGNSSDQTISIINSYRNKKIIIHKAKSTGIYNAMNEGIAIANGKWLYFLGSDDKLCNNNVLQIIYNVTSETNIKMVYGNVIGSASKKTIKSPNKLSLIRTGFHHQAFFYKGELFSKKHGYRSIFKVSADYYFTLTELLKRKTSYIYVDAMICEYGEKGFSATNVDYFFFSKHYSIIKDATKEFPNVDFNPEIMTSINCCLYLAKKKEHTFSAWREFIICLNAAKISFKEKQSLTLRMAKNTIKFW